MSRRHFSWLFALTLAVALVIAFLPGRVGRESAIEVRPLLPDLAQRVNDLDEIRVVRGGGEPVATLRRGESTWTVDEADGYPADWSRLRALLAALAQARAVEPKTANPEYFDRLGLADVSDPDSKAVRVQLGAGEDAPAVLVGDAARNRDGQYVRIEGEDRAWLIDRSLDVPTQTRDWLDRQIVDLAETEVVEVDITHPDGETVKLRKVSADDADFVLQDVPEGRAAQDSWTLNATGGGLAGLRLDEVRRADRVAFEEAVRVRVLTADGLTVEAQLAVAEEKQWIKLQAASLASATAAPAEIPDEIPDEGGSEVTAADTAADNAETPPAAAGAAASADGESGSDAVAAAAQRPQDRAAEINQRVSGWAYVIPQYKYEVLVRRTADLLKPAEPAD